MVTLSSNNGVSFKLVRLHLHVLAIALFWFNIVSKAVGAVNLVESYVGTSCPGTMVTYTCVAFNTDTLQWTITLSGGQTSINTFTRWGNQQGATQTVQLIGQDDIVLTLSEINVISMMSTLSTTLSQGLDGAQVTCSSIDGNFMTTDSDSAIITVVGVPSAPQDLMASNVIQFSNSVHVHLEWEHSFNIDFTSTFPNRGNYIITTDPLTSSTTTTIERTTIDLQYNVNYTVSVKATNCAGESGTATLQLGPYASSGLLPTQPSGVDHNIHTEISTTPTDILTTPPGTDLPQSESPRFNIVVIIIAVVVVGVGVVIIGCLAALFIAVMFVAMKKRKGSTERPPQLERQSASDSLYYDVIYPVQNIAYDSAPSKQPPSCDIDGCDEAGYEVVDHDNEYSESVLTASYNSYAEASGQSERSTVSYLNIVT